MSLAGRVPGRESFATFIASLEKQVREAGITVLLNRKATPDHVRQFSPDVVILATGAFPVVPSFIKDGNTRLFTAWDVLKGTIPEGDQIVILGGGGVGLETAHFLARRNKRVKIIEATNLIGRDLGPIISSYLRRMLSRAGVEIIRNTEVKEVENNQVHLLVGGQEASTIGQPDGIVLALGARPENSLAEELTGHTFDLHVIGMPSSPGGPSTLSRRVLTPV